MKLNPTMKALSLAALSISLLTACGTSNFQVQGYQATASAGNQSVITMPKVDIVFFQDDSDSTIYGPIQTIMPQMAAFAANLGSTVDYRFVVLPLLSQQSIQGKYFLANDCSSAPANLGNCLTQSQIGTFNGAGNNQSFITQANSSIGSSDYGFLNMISNLNRSGMIVNGTNSFLRPDASTAIVMLTNGNDIEGAQYSTRSDGVTVLSGYTDDNSSNFNAHLAFFKGLKNGMGTSFFPVVAQGGNCYGYNSIYGSRYVKMASALNSPSFNLCGGQLGNVLNNVFANVQTLVQTVKFNYAVVSATDVPSVSSIVVKKNGSTIPMCGTSSSTDCWKYIGQYSGPTSYYPASGNNRSGYSIELFGSAVYSGTDSITIDYSRG